MPVNKGYLTAKTDKASDETYTPFYAVDPLKGYFKAYQNRHPGRLRIWCPFDAEWSAFVQRFTEWGYPVIATHIDDGYNFFEYEPENYDIIISNPPFSLKDMVLKRLWELNKPYAMLLPLNTIQGEKRYPYMKGIQMLAFDKRINFHCEDNLEQTKPGVAFASVYICKNFLPKDLIIEKLERKEESLI